MVDQQEEIIKLLSQLVQKSSQMVHTVATVAPISHSQAVVMTQASYTTLPLRSTPATATCSSFTSLQEETTDDDYSFINSPSWISLLSDTSTGDPGSNSEPQRSTDLPQPLYDPSNYSSISSRPEMSTSAVTMQPLQSMPAATMQSMPAVTMQSTGIYPSPINPASLPQQAQLFSPTQPPPPPFSTPPKLRAVDEVMRDHPGTDVHSLRRLATGIAREAIFGKKELQQSSLSGKNRTGSLDKTKLDYIKNVVKSRVPSMSLVEFEFVYGKCAEHQFPSPVKLYGLGLKESCEGLKNCMTIVFIMIQ